MSFSSPSSSPTSTRKRIHTEVEPLDSSNEQDALDANSDDETGSDEPQPLRVTDSTVLSHAERRRQKKKELKQLAAASSGPASKKRKLDDSTAQVQAKTTTKAKAKTRTKSAATPSTDDPRRSKRQHSVWVGNLSFRTTENALREFFDGVGTITRVHMPMKRGKQGQDENMGFAYVDFEKSDGKVIAITLSEGVLDGRNLLIKDGDDFTGRPAKAKAETSEGADGQGNAKSEVRTDSKGLSKTAQKILRVQKQPPAQTLFLGNLGFETTEQSIRELFEAHRYGRDQNKAKVEPEELTETENGAAASKDVWIRKIRMGTFEDSGNCKGFAFVDFTSIQHATEALVNPRNHRLNGRELVVEYASPDAVRRGGGPRSAKGDRDRKDTSGSATPYAKRRQPRQTHIERGDGTDVKRVVAETREVPRSARSDRVRHDQPHARRARPGAALAHAQRQSAAILPGQGQKIMF